MVGGTNGWICSRLFSARSFLMCDALMVVCWEVRRGIWVVFMPYDGRIWDMILLYWAVTLHVGSQPT